MDFRICPKCRSNDTCQLWEMGRKWVAPPGSRKCLNCGYIWHPKKVNDDNLPKNPA